MKELLMADLFAGCGGLSTGFEQAGFTPWFVNELVSDFCNTYKRNHSLPDEHFFVGDIIELNAQIAKYRYLLKDISVVCGGPPCQGFSMANRQRIIDDPRNNLYKAYLLFLKETKPMFFVMENVRGMRNKINEIRQDFAEFLGGEYQFDYEILNARNFGVPQNRERFIMIGNRLGINPKDIFNEIRKGQRTEFCLKDALVGLPKLSNKQSKGKSNIENVDSGFTECDYRYEHNDFYRFINDDREITKLYNHKNRYNNDRDIEIFRRLPQGANSLHSSIADIMPYSRRCDIFKDKYYKLREDEVCKTITSHMKYDCNMYIHPWEPRGLSPREAARIQTFPDDYVFTGPQNSWFTQIGNAVPVKLAYAIGRGIKKFI